MRTGWLLNYVHFGPYFKYFPTSIDSRQGTDSCISSVVTYQRDMHSNCTGLADYEQWVLVVTLKVSGPSNFHYEACLNVIMVEQSNSNSSPGQMVKQGMIGLDCCAASGWSRHIYCSNIHPMKPPLTPDVVSLIQQDVVFGCCPFLLCFVHFDFSKWFPAFPWMLFNNPTAVPLWPLKTNILFHVHSARWSLFQRLIIRHCLGVNCKHNTVWLIIKAIIPTYRAAAAIVHLYATEHLTQAARVFYVQHLLDLYVFNFAFGIQGHQNYE